jgi:hypothetical protein
MKAKFGSTRPSVEENTGEDQDAGQQGSRPDIQGSGGLPCRMAAANPYNKDEDFIFASPKLKQKLPQQGQTTNADFVKPAVLAVGLVGKG